MAAPMVIWSLRIPRRFSQVYAASFKLTAPRTEYLKARKSCFGLNVNTSTSVRFSDQSSMSSVSSDPAATAATTTAATYTSTAAADEEIASPDQQMPRTIPVSPEKAKQEKLLLQFPDQPADARSLKVAIIGSPNAGKSTFINRLLGQRIFSVSSKVHTTRSNALAVLTTGNTQIVLLDTPGMVSHRQGRKHQLARSLLIDPKNSLEEADLALVLVDASNKWTCTKIANEILLSLHLQPKVSTILVLNKVDLISKKQDLLLLTALLTEGIINGARFTMDDWTARNLSEVVNRRLMSYKYKPKPPSKHDADISSDSGAITKFADKPAQNNYDETASCLGSTESSDDPVCENSSEREELKLELEKEDINDTILDNPSMGTIAKQPPALTEYDSSEDTLSQDSSQTEHLESELENVDNKPANDQIQTDHKIGAISELPPTLEEYVNTLEHFTSYTDFDKPVKSAVDRTKTKVASTEKERQKRLLAEVDKRSGWDKFEAVFMVSALTGEGIEDVKEHLLSKAVPGDWEYHEDVLTNLSPEEILTEAITEKLLEYLPQEVPYNITQSNEFLETLNDGTVRIIQKIICHKKSHVKMLKRHIGQIAREAEQNLKNAFQQDVHLTLKIILR